MGHNPKIMIADQPQTLPLNMMSKIGPERRGSPDSVIDKVGASNLAKQMVPTSTTWWQRGGGGSCSTVEALGSPSSITECLSADPIPPSQTSASPRPHSLPATRSRTLHKKGFLPLSLILSILFCAIVLCCGINQCHGFPEPQPSTCLNERFGYFASYGYGLSSFPQPSTSPQRSDSPRNRRRPLKHVAAAARTAAIWATTFLTCVGSLVA